MSLWSDEVALPLKTWNNGVFENLKTVKSPTSIL